MRNSIEKSASRRTALRQITTGVAAMATGLALPRSISAVTTCEHISGPGETSWPSSRATPDQRGISKSTLPSDPQLKWAFPSPDGWVAAVAIVGDVVYAPALAGYL